MTSDDYKQRQWVAGKPLVLEDTGVDLSILITCYNEHDLIGDTLHTVLQALKESGQRYEILVIDDCSRDGSREVIQRFIDDHPGEPVSFYPNEFTRGLANNFIEGAFLARGKYYRLCCGDNPESKEGLVKLFSLAGRADLILPYQNQEMVKGKSPLRRWLSKTFSAVVNLTSGYKIKYYNGSPIFLRYAILRWPSITYGFGFQADLITRLLDEGVTFTQVPMENTIDRKGSDSTALSLRNLLSVTHTFLEIVFRRVRRVMYGGKEARAKEINVTTQ